jgi:hypothetical protein
MVGLLRAWVADDFLAGSLEFLNGELHKAKPFVACEHFAWVPTFSSDHHRHRLVLVVVVERGAVGAILPWLLWKMTRRNPSPDNGLQR